MTLYDGRIGGKADALMEAINRSLPVDIRLLPCDVRTNRAWARELARLGFYNPGELADVERTLDEILALAEKGAFDPLPEDEDVHTLVERLLTERLGDVGARIHTGRSRNDQVACDLRLYLMEALAGLKADVAVLVGKLLELVKAHRGTLLAGATHLQPAQPITLGHFLASLAFALIRDAERLDDCLWRAERCPLGSGALAGSGFPVDRHALAEALGFSGILDNTLDAVGDRDAAQEAAGVCAILIGHLSRYAEQFIIWSHPAFGYLRFSDAWSTGSSMMPQKRNPDAMELIRAKAARAIGSTVTLLAMTKGVPPGYAKDLQEDKAALFDVLDAARLVVKVFAEALGSAAFYPERMRADLRGDLLATDLADRLAEAGAPFRKAHERVGRFIGELERQGRDLMSATPRELDERFPELGGQPFEMSFAAAVERRRVAGGPAAASLSEQIEKIADWLASQKP
ncbi:MAG: argininosuccinate lyase [Myxococcales bacterium]|nr:MAG: argininosuccinate lyase [Myxococcales bacterium]